MTEAQRKVISADRKRLILIADDEMINREILGVMLGGEYEVLYACDGAETLSKMREYQAGLSLVLLDILMPEMSGLEVLKAVHADAELSGIPVIVMTGEKDTEVTSLELGAMDFIPKPYPAPGIVLARVKRIIELMEDRDTIDATERDALTGLYNKEFFFRYAAREDQFHPEKEMDAVHLDINHFHHVNERYGRAYGDELLKGLGRTLKEIARENDGITCRQGADTFMLYVPHLEDYDGLLERITDSLPEHETGDKWIRIRMGVYPNADKSVDIERRFDRAKMAADDVRQTLTRNIAYYDEKLHETQLFHEQLIEEFPAAIANNQFLVYYQPKFDVRPDTPILESAEALVRWKHPTLGMISPGDFIPLFEENGLIQILDHYVWRETARQIREWKDELDFSIPISVNVSRIDLLDEDLPKTLQDILEEYSLTGDDFLLEVTESAYTQDSDFVINMAERLRGQGFRIEMDDFGTGYSSLHMVSSLPIDALKLDMCFVRDAFQKGGNTHMMEVVIGIADFLSVPVIAEGVETHDQLHALKILGCDFVQGYFFSKPVPASEFKAFILQKKEVYIAAKQETRQEIRNTFSEVEEVPAPEEGLRRAEDGEEAKSNKTGEEAGMAAKPGEKKALSLRTASIFFAVMAFVAAIALLVMDISVTRGYQKMKAASDRHVEAQLAASDLEAGSDYLTDRVRSFVVTGELKYLTDFFEEVNVTRRRDTAVENLKEYLHGTDGAALQNLTAALNLSNELIGVEYMAMGYVVSAGDYDAAQIPLEIEEAAHAASLLGLSDEELVHQAQLMVFDQNYLDYKEKIREKVRLCTEDLIRSSSQELENASHRMTVLVNVQTVLTIVFLLVVLWLIIIIAVLVRKPLTSMVNQMQNNQTVPEQGVEELRFVTRIYNRIFEENRAAREKLSHEASHDALTGLYNRGAYDLWMEGADTDHIALILIDVDYFKSINDTYGHAGGDRVLKRVAEILRASFRSVDIICRIGGDEFAVIMTRVNSSMRQLVENKISRANELLQNPKDSTPPASLSVGVAFSDRKNPEGDIFMDADAALYRVKNAGRKGCCIY